MRDHGSRDVRTAAYLAASEAWPEDKPSPDEYQEDPMPREVFPRCPATEAETGFTYQCALPECRTGMCVRALATPPAVADAVTR